MKRVIASLSEDPSTRIFLFGGGEEEKLILGRWSEEFPRVTSMARERFGFRTEMAVMSLFDVMVAMDSGNMHLAALTGVPTVTVWERPTLQWDSRPAASIRRLPYRYRWRAAPARCLATVPAAPPTTAA